MPAVPPDFSGQYVRQYLIISMLGSGGAGCVYHAVDTSSELQRSYALKCVCANNLTPHQLLQQTSEVFHHQLVNGCAPSVLSLRDVMQEDLYLWMVLDLCEGGDLVNAIWRDQVYCMNDALIKRAFIEILDGVYACHQRGVFHRDLKPGNILCRAGGSGIRIADFGLATRSRICKAHRCGTLEYMSPECNENLVYYPASSDVWSLGIILINMVSGYAPWRAASASDKEFKAFLNNEDYLFETLPISRSLNELLKWILHPKPLDRLRIPQIKQTILRMDSFYKRPRTFSIRSRELEAHMWEVNLRNFVDPEDLPREKYSCRPRLGTRRQGLSFIDDSTDSEVRESSAEKTAWEDAAVNLMELPSVLLNIYSKYVEE